MLALADLLVQSLPAQRRQLGLQLALLGFVLLIFLRRLCLTMQALQLTFQLLTQIGQASQVFMSAADTSFGFAAALLVFGDAGRLFDEVTQVFRLGLDQLGDHALLDDRIAAWPQTGTQEDVGDVAPTTFHTVEKVCVLSVTRHPPADRDFCERRVFAQQRTVRVIEDQFDAGLGHWLAGVRAVEDDIGHRLAAQVLRRAFAHHPAHGIDDVGLSATIGADHCRHVAGKADRGGIDEGFEAGKLDAFQTH